MRISARRQAQIAWCLYDWASSAFPVIVTTFVFAAYFTSNVAANEITGTYQWANAIALAGILIAVSGPIFGAIADHRGEHKKWLFLLTLLCILSSALLWFAYPSVSSVYFTLTCVVVGTFGLEIATVFYNAFLPQLASENYVGRLSGWAWGIGYLGGIAALSLVLFGFIQAKPAWLDTQTSAQIRLCGPLTALWFLIFSLPLFIFVPDTPATPLSNRAAIREGLKGLAHTLKSLPSQKNLVLFLLAHLLYADGLNTLFAFGGIYAAGTFHMNLSHVILFGITTNVSAGIGAIAFAWLDDLLGSKPVILMSLMGLIGFGIFLVIVQNAQTFWVLALVLSLFVGPVQSASRSFMARLAPPERSTELFGLYAFSGKITSFTGPWILGLATWHFHSQRAGIATILLFFLVGGILLCFVEEKKHARKSDEKR